MRAIFQADHKKRFQADKKSNEEPIDIEAIRQRADELMKSAQQTAESVTPYSRYKELKKSDPRAAGEYWRANADKIKACI